MLVGSEPTFDNYIQTGPEMQKMIKDDGAPIGPLGYRALMDRGFSKDHAPAHIQMRSGRLFRRPSPSGVGSSWMRAFPRRSCIRTWRLSSRLR